jgi:outer membrane protein OmpA-like peptidoglycan-associated protein
LKNHFSLFLLIFSLFSLLSVRAQKPEKKFKSGGVVQLNDTLTAYSQSDIFTFTNVNQIPYYYDKNKYQKIEQQMAQSNDKALYITLRSYVKNFGTENFSRDVGMLWRLARLSEKYGPAGESILLYKLVLKHHQQGIDINKVRQEYDELTRNERDYYVPLQQYFELVDYRKEIDTLRPPHGVLLNMGPSVNSAKADYAPTIGNVDTIMLFTSKRNINNQSLERRYDEDLFFSVNDMGFWNEAQEFVTINSIYNEGSACLSKDGKQLFFARCDSPDSKGSCDIFVADLLPNNLWGNVRNLGDNVNSVFWDSHPSLSHSGDTLFFSSDRRGGFGMTDIYYSTKNKKGEWQPARNIGPIINTRGQEVSPFFHHKFNVLYFSSNGHPLNFGDFDIYKSYKTSKVWGEPKNIGPLVNGPGSEYYFTIDSESSLLYYARSEDSTPEDLDLHSFPVPMEAQPEAIARLSGSLTNSQTKQPMKGIVSIIDIDQGVEVAPKYLRPDGSFDFNLINQRNYLLIIQGDDFFRIEEMFFLDGDMEINKETEPIESKIAFKSLEFESGKADILPGMWDDLNKIGNFLVDHPGMKININGHTDSEGRADANLRLSQARADAIREYLIQEFKIQPERITANGYGGTRPLVEEKTDDDRKLNRRVEFEISRIPRKN